MRRCVGVGDAEAGADGRAERHDGGGADVDEALGENDVVGGVGQDGEAFLDEDAGGFDGGLDVGVEGGLVADDLDLDPVGEADLAAKARGADGFLGGVAAGGVGQEEVALRVDEVEQGFLERSRLTRRTATVTISAPEASMAAAVSGPSLYLPVPTMRRERKRRPAMTRSSAAGCVVRRGPERASLMEMQITEIVTRANGRTGIGNLL